VLVEIDGEPPARAPAAVWQRRRRDRRKSGAEWRGHVHAVHPEPDCAHRRRLHARLVAVEIDLEHALDGSPARERDEDRAPLARCRRSGRTVATHANRYFHLSTIQDSANL